MKRFRPMYHDATLREVRSVGSGDELVFRMDLNPVVVSGGGSASVILGRLRDRSATLTAVDRLRAQRRSGDDLGEIVGIMYAPDAPAGWKRVVFDLHPFGPMAVDCKDVSEV